MRILSGITPSGLPHIGNYFGMLKPAVELQEKGEAFIFIADFHALTVNPSPDELRERSIRVAVDVLSIGLDPEKAVFFRQSDIAQVTELTWILNCITSMGLLERAHSYKDKIAHGFTPNAGLFDYPVLMASDILIYRSNLVPVGKDQKQHLEISRDLALRFNNTYGDIFKIPEAMIRSEYGLIPGIDGQKMSKSYYNTINIFGKEKQLKKTIMSMVTDSKGLDEPKDPDKCNILALYKLFANEQQVQKMKENYRAGGYGYGHAKQELFSAYWEYFTPMRKKREELLDNMDYVDEVLRKGAEKASEEAEKVMKDVRSAIGLR